MDKESMLQAAEYEWLECYHDDRDWMMDIYGTSSPDVMPMPWFWLILAESIWPSPTEFDGFFQLTYSQWLKEQDEREESGE